MASVVARAFIVRRRHLIMSSWQSQTVAGNRTVALVADVVVASAVIVVTAVADFALTRPWPSPSLSLAYPWPRSSPELLAAAMSSWSSYSRPTPVHVSRACVIATAAAVVADVVVVATPCRL